MLLTRMKKDASVNKLLRQSKLSFSDRGAFRKERRQIDVDEEAGISALI